MWIFGRKFGRSAENCGQNYSSVICSDQKKFDYYTSLKCKKKTYPPIREGVGFIGHLSQQSFNFKEILSPSETKTQHFCHFWDQFEVYEDIISDLTYKNFLYSETKRFLMISQIFSKIISFLCFYITFIRIFLLFPVFERYLRKF